MPLIIIIIIIASRGKNSTNCSYCLPDVPSTAADDSDSAGWLPADSRAEDLQVPAAIARATLLHVARTPRLHGSHDRRRRHEGHDGTGERAQEEDGEYGETGGMAALRRTVAGDY